MREQGKGIRERDELIDLLRAGVVAALMNLEAGQHSTAAEVLRIVIAARVPS